MFIQQRQRGDVLIATSAIARLRQAFPDAQIDAMTEKMCEQILENNPHINRIISIDKSKQKTIFQQIAFYRNVAKQGKYDTVVSMQNLPRCLMQVIFSGAKYRIGLKSKRWFYNACYTHLAAPSYIYAGRQKVDTLKPLGITSNENDKPEWFISSEESKIADKILGDCGYDSSKHMLISIDATHRHRARRYPAKNYAYIINKIKEEYPNAKFLFVRAPGEEDQVNECISMLDDKSCVVFPEECPSMRISGALASNAVYHIGNCSFPRHLAVALDIPSSIFVGASDWTWGIQNEMHKELKVKLDCMPCNNDNCAHVSCLVNLKPEAITNDILEHIKMYKK